MLPILVRNWWVLALRGAVAILVGILALAYPDLTLEAFVIIFGIYAIIDGVMALAAGMRAAERHERWATLIVEGVLDLVAGAVMLLWPGLSLVALVLFLGIWAVVTGVALLAAAMRLRRLQGDWLLVFSGLASIVLGVILFLWPIAGIVALAWWFGIYAIVFGGLLVALAFRLRALRDPGEPAPRYH
jgi:uncharacterized membrane protein HdeD (DUF308 family)